MNKLDPSKQMQAGKKNRKKKKRVSTKIQWIKDTNNDNNMLVQSSMANDITKFSPKKRNQEMDNAHTTLHHHKWYQKEKWGSKTIACIMQANLNTHGKQKIF